MPSISFKETSVVVGFGARLNLDLGLYADLRFDYMVIDDIDTDQASFTLGYKF
ncbi:MAG: outer membrane beta-barrel protein [Psychromonas sp.]